MPRGRRPSVVDNTFASPYLFNPASHGVDVVLHSATKYIGGHHDLIGGVACATAETVGRLRDTVIETGWHDGAARGVAVRARARDARAADGATLGERAGAFEHLEAHPKVERVHYPGLASHPQHDVAERLLRKGYGGMMAFEVAGGVEAGQRFCDALEIAWVAASLGGIHTLVGHAASTTHRQMDPQTRRAAGIADGLVRISVGIEDVEDLVEDVDRALEAA